MGLLKLPQIRDYRSKHEILVTPWFPAIMSRDHYFQILQYLHLVDSSQQKKKGEPGYDPLYKVRLLLDHLVAVFPIYYQPEQQLSIDEMMIGTRCRVSFLQYLPKKPTKFGIKVFVNLEAKTGYVLNLQVYVGAADDSTGKDGVGHRVVMDLMDRYHGKGHCVYVDNNYTSPQLLLDLLSKGTFCAGTIKTNRKGFPKDLVPDDSSKMPIGSFRFATTPKLTAVWWRDRRDVFALSTIHSASACTVMKCPKGCKDKRPTPCPTIISDYNLYMGGVDLTDQHLSYYSLTTRRSIKWWKKVFWRLIDICIVNAWIIYHTNYPDDKKIKSHKDFRLKLIDELVQPLLDLKASPNCPAHLRGTGRAKKYSSEVRLNGKHFPKKHSQRKRCVVCNRHKNVDKKTQNYCEKCDAFLCFGKCFEVFHTRSTY